MPNWRNSAEARDWRVKAGMSPRVSESQHRRSATARASAAALARPPGGPISTRCRSTAQARDRVLPGGGLQLLEAHRQPASEGVLDHGGHLPRPARHAQALLSPAL